MYLFSKLVRNQSERNRTRSVRLLAGVSGAVHGPSQLPPPDEQPDVFNALGRFILKRRFGQSMMCYGTFEYCVLLSMLIMFDMTVFP